MWTSTGSGSARFPNINAMKKIFTVLLVSGCCLGHVYAQQNDHILDWKAGTTLYHFVTERLHEQYRLRDSTLHAALDAETVPAYQQGCIKRYLDILGQFPAKTPLHPEITGTLRRNGYRIDKLTYESFPAHHVTANLYVPDGKGPFPGLLFFCGHEATAKATATYQQTAIRLARGGFVVLSIDPISQGERFQITDRNGKPETRGGTTAHTLLGAGSNLAGTSVVAYQIWDNERGLDYLCSLPEVDTSRLGCLGNSGGGTQTAYFLPYDARIKVAVVCSYVTRRERTLELLGPQDGCQWLPGESEAALDISDYLVMFAPKPVLILAGRYGFVDFNGTMDVYRELKSVYGSLGHPEKVGLFASDNGHGIQTQKQLAAVKWFRRWFYGSDLISDSLPPAMLSAHALQVTRTGQVNGDFPHEKNIQDANLALADQTAASRKRMLDEYTPRRYRDMLRKAIAYEAGGSRVDTQHMGTFQQGPYHFVKLILRRPGMPPLPCLYGRLDIRTVSGKLWILLDDHGKGHTMEEDSLLQATARLGYDVLAPDLRGFGETSDNPDMNDAKYLNSGYRCDMLSLFIGKPIPTQRAEDIRTLTLFYAGMLGKYPDSLMIRATGKTAEPALIAACLNPRITRVELLSQIHSFYQLLHHPMMKDQYDYVIPGVLKYFDLPDLVTFAGRGRIWFQPGPLPAR